MFISCRKMSNLIRFEQQNYEKIKKGLLKRKELFVDETFPANDSTLTLELRGEELTWKRPSVGRNYKKIF